MTELSILGDYPLNSELNHHQINLFNKIMVKLNHIKITVMLMI